MVDIGIIAIVIVFALIGFMRGTWNSLFKLIMAILCIPLAVFIGNLAYEKIAGVNLNQLFHGIVPIPFESINGIGAWLRSLDPTINEMINATPSLGILIDNWSEVFAKVLMIYIIGIALFVAMVAVSGLLWHLLIKHLFPKAKIRIGGAVISAVQAVVIVGFVLMPVIIARPLVAKLQESEITSTDMNNTISTGTDFVDTSFSIKLIDKLASPFTKKIGNYTNEDKTYNAFSEFEEAIDVLDLGMSLQATFVDSGDLFAMDFNNLDVVELRIALTNLGDTLSDIDNRLNALSQTSNIRNVTEELVIYLLNKLFDETEIYSEIDLTGLDFSEEFNIKDQVMPLLLAMAISNLEEQYPFLQNLDLSAMTFDEIVDEILAYASAAALFDEISQIINDVNNVGNVDPALIQTYFENIANSEGATELLENLIEDMSSQTGLDFTGVNLLSEGELMALLMTLSQSPNPSEEDCITLAIGVAHSVTTYQFVLLMTSPTVHMVTVDALTYANISAALVADSVDPVIAANVMNIYQIA